MKYSFLYIIAGIDLINELLMRDTGPSSTWDDYKSKKRVKDSEQLKRNTEKLLKNKYCEKCNVSFATHFSLIRHYQRAHPDDQVPKIQIPKIQQEKENQNVTDDKIQEENENSTEDEEEEEENSDEKDDSQTPENQTDDEDFGNDDEEYVVEKVLGKRLGKKGTIGNLFPKKCDLFTPISFGELGSWVHYPKTASTGSYTNPNINFCIFPSRVFVEMERL